MKRLFAVTGIALMAVGGITACSSGPSYCELVKDDAGISATDLTPGKADSDKLKKAKAQIQKIADAAPDSDKKAWQFYLDNLDALISGDTNKLMKLDSKKATEYGSTVAKVTAECKKK